MSLKNVGVSLPSLCDPVLTLGQLSKQQEITENEVGTNTNQLELNGTSVCSPLTLIVYLSSSCLLWPVLTQKHMERQFGVTVFYTGQKCHPHTTNCHFDIYFRVLCPLAWSFFLYALSQ